MRQQATLLSLYCICSQKANPICCAAGEGALWPRQNGLPLLQCLQKPPVRRAKVRKARLRRAQPAQRMVLQGPGCLPRQTGGQEGQVDRHVRIRVDRIPKRSPGLHRDRQLLSQLPGQGLGQGLARLQLAAGKFPSQPPRLMRRALAGQKGPILPV